MKNLGGIEDIPSGVVAVLSRSAVDVLSHIAIRARNQVQTPLDLYWRSSESGAVWCTSRRLKKTI